MKTELDAQEIEALAQALAPKVADALRSLLAPKVVPMPKAPEGEPFFTVETLAAYLKVRPSTVYNYVHLKKIPYFKQGKFTRFRKAEIEAWHTAHSVRPE